MESILNELSIAPVQGVSANERMLTLVAALTALRGLGLSRALRSTRDVLERRVATDMPLRTWLFALHEHREAKQLLKSALNKAPFVEDLHERAQVEQRRQFEVVHGAQQASGLGTAFLHQSVAISVCGFPDFTLSPVAISVSSLDENGTLSTTEHGVLNVWDVVSVGQSRDQITSLLLAAVASGENAWARRADLFSHLEWSREAEEQLRSMRGSELRFRGIIDRLVILNQYAASWSGGPFEPPLNFSPDTGNTLKDGRVGAERNCTLPSGEVKRLSLHIKLMDYWRIYFEFRQVDETSSDQGARGRVLVGYIGKHLRL